MRLRHKAHGVVVNVDDETGTRMLGGPCESADKPVADKPRPRRTAKKDDEDAGSSDHTR